MITELQIKGLRGVRGGAIEGIAPLTFLVGPNGCGKSTVLEALGLACAGSSAKEAFDACGQREWLGLAGLEHLLPEGSATVVAVVRPGKVVGLRQSKRQVITATLTFAREQTGAHFSAGCSVRLEDDPGDTTNASDVAYQPGSIVLDDDGFSLGITGNRGVLLPFSLQSAFTDRPAGARRRFAEARFSSALREALTETKKSAWYGDWFAYLQEIRPNVTSIESLAVGDRDEPHVIEHEPHTVYPLAFAGDGFRRALLLAGAFARARGGMAAIDEPEAYAHPGMYAGHAKLVRRVLGDDTQIVMATHSLEYVAALIEELEDQAQKLAVVGLRMRDGALDPIVVPGLDARRRILDLGHDLRL